MQYKGIMNYLLHKKLWSSMFVFVIASTILLGQPCTPDLSYTVPGVYPDTLKYGYAGQSYTMVIDFRVPKDTFVLTIPTTIDSLLITGLEGLPPGFSYECNISSCNFLGGTNGCAAITGNPDSTMISTWPLKLITKTFARLNMTTPIVQIDTITDFFLTICAADSNCSGDTLSAVKELNYLSPFENLKVYPNPAANWTIIEVSALRNERAVVLITDALGMQIREIEVELGVGLNKIPVNLTGLSTGILIITMYTDKKIARNKFVHIGED